ncbi:MAG: redoxin family protein [Methanosarcinales archaeon]|nr:redoxin family protein [Methanosarcinales archaeon]
MSINHRKIHVILLMVAISIIGIAASSGCLNVPSSDNETTTSQSVGSSPVWANIELTDVATGESFKLSDFKGKPILVESFAVWCPTCLQQQKITEKLKSTEGDAIIHVSLDTDPNEDEAKIKEHIETHGFDWYYAVSPIELTTALMDEFGQSVVFAPGAPVILICEDGSARLLKKGVKSANVLLSEVKKGC